MHVYSNYIQKYLELPTVLAQKKYIAIVKSGQIHIQEIIVDEPYASQVITVQFCCGINSLTMDLASTVVSPKVNF